MRAHRAWRAGLAAAVLVAGACGDGGTGDDGEGAGGLRKLPLGAVGSGRSSATMSAEAAADSSSKSMIAPLRAVEYRLAADPDDVPATATAYEVTSQPADEVRAKVAKALDVDPERVEVGPFGYDWYYSGNVSPDTAVSSSPACAPDQKCADPSPPPTVRGVPSAADAEKRVKGILETMGASLDGRFEVYGEDGYNRTVQFTPSVDGIPVAGLQTSIAFGADARIEYANGLFADVKSIGEYPLVGLDEAVKRLQEGFGAGGVRTMGAPEPAIDPAATSDSSGSSSGGGSAGSTGSAGSGVAEEEVAPSEPATDPPPPEDEPTMTIEPDQGFPREPLEAQVVEITGADLSLQLVAAGCPGDPVYLVPTFDLLPGPAASIIAVEDDVIAGQGTDAKDAQELEPCPDQGPTGVPMGKPEPAPMPADAGREPAKP